MAQQWYYLRQGQQVGPVEDSEIRRLAETGQLLASDYVWSPGLPQWQRLGSVPGLMPPVLGTAPPAPPYPPPYPPGTGHLPAGPTPTGPLPSATWAPRPAQAPVDYHPFPLAKVLTVITLAVVLLCGGIVGGFVYLIRDMQKKVTAGLARNAATVALATDPQAVFLHDFPPWAAITSNPGGQRFPNQAQSRTASPTPGQATAADPDAAPSSLDAVYPRDATHWPSPLPVTDGFNSGGLRFSGNQHLTIPSHPLVQLNQPQVTLLITFSSASPQKATLLSRSHAPGAGFEIELDQGDLVLSIGDQTIVAKQAVVDNSTHQLAVLVNHGSVRVYLDATLVGKGMFDTQAPAALGQGDTFLGRSALPQDPQHFTGSIRQVALFTRLFTEDELAEHAPDPDEDDEP
jgi:hypothetical protein